jgi:hypothetical protein
MVKIRKRTSSKLPATNWLPPHSSKTVLLEKEGTVTIECLVGTNTRTVRPKIDAINLQLSLCLYTIEYFKLKNKQSLIFVIV